MSEQAWFKLLIRAIGVFLVATATPELISSLAQTIAMVQWQQTNAAGSPGGWEWEWNYYAYVVASLVKLAIGIYLLIGGAWLFRRCMRDLDGHCFGCGYAIHNVTGEACPECGLRFRTAAASPAPPQAPAS